MSEVRLSNDGAIIKSWCVICLQPASKPNETDEHRYNVQGNFCDNCCNKAHRNVKRREASHFYLNQIRGKAPVGNLMDDEEEE